jgi:hypothetical protein
MISVFGTSLGATAPLLLLGVPLATALLVYVYRNQGTSKHAVVSTLLFLRELPNRPTSRKKFEPPLQFWIELAALSLLSLAAAGLFLANTGSTIAIVIDQSLSMQAPGKDGATRFETVKRLAVADLTNSLPTTRFSVFSAHSTLTPISSAKVSALEAASVISALNTLQTEDRLQNHLNSLINGGQYDSVWVYTDRVLEASTMPPKLRIVSVTGDVGGRPVANLWLRNLTPKTSEGKTYLSATLQEVGTPTLPVTLSTFCYDSSTGAPSRPRMLPDVTIEVHNGVPITTQLGPLDFSWSHCRVVAASGSTNASDLLADDNDGWVTSESVVSRVELTGPLSPEQLKIGRLGSVSVVASPRDASTQPGAPLPKIIHRSSVSSEPESPTLMVFPQPGPLPWGGAVRESESRATEMSRWDNAHPVLTYVNPTLLDIRATRLVSCPPSATPLLTTTAGTVACVGEQQGVRYAIVGFEIFPFDGAKTPTLSILTLNLFKWIFESTASSLRALPYESMTIPRGVTEAAYVAPDTSAITISQANTIVPTKAGVIQLSNSKLGTSTTKAINLFSDHESDLSRNPPLSIPLIERAETKPSRESFDMTYWLIVCALVALLFDLFRRIIRVSRWSRT